MGEAVYSSLGYRFAFIWDDAEVGARACRLISDFAEPITPGLAGSGSQATYRISTELRSKGPWYTLRSGDAIVAGTPDRQRIAERLLARVSADAIEACEDYLLVHAGAVATPGGEGILVLGDSGAGKTTLVAALVQEGYGYLSDEAGVLDFGDALMHPWPRPLGFERGTQQMKRFAEIIDSGEGPKDGTRHVPAATLRAGAVSTSCRVRQILEYSYQPDADTVLRPLSAAEAVVAVGRSAPSLRRHGQRGLDLIVSVVEGARRQRMVSGDLDQAVRALRELVQQ